MIPLEAGFPLLLRSPEEAQHLGRAIGIAQGDLNPGWFVYPSLHYYLLGATFKVAHGSAAESPQDARWSLDHARTSRWLSLWLGIASTIALYFAGLALAGRVAARLASFFTAVNPLHLSITTDTAVDASFACFLSLAVLFIIRVGKDPSSRNCLLAGLFAGLAMSAKQPGVLLFLLLVLPSISAPFGAICTLRLGLDGPCGRWSPWPGWRRLHSWS